MPGQNNTTINGGKKVMAAIKVLLIPFFSNCKPSAQKSVKHNATPKKDVRTQIEVNNSAKNETELSDAVVLMALTKSLVERSELRIWRRPCSPSMGMMPIMAASQAI